MENETLSIDIRVPDIGDFKDVEVIEVSVTVGSKLAKEQSILTVETDKATMDIPSPVEGVIREILIKAGDRVSEGTLILKLEAAVGAKPESSKTQEQEIVGAGRAQFADEARLVPTASTTIEKKYTDEPATSENGVHAGPATRRLARELGVDLKQVPGTGRKGRLLTSDLHQHVKQKLSQSTSSGGLNIIPAKSIDFSQFGETESKPLNRIKQLTAENLHRNWVTIPHVTHFDEADITELEIFRKDQKATADQLGVKLTPIVFILKAVVSALRAFPSFNSSLSLDGKSLILKKYFHIGVAVDTPNGLVVPVIQNVDAKSMYQLAQELQAISTKAREKGLTIAEMSGSCFTISSLGGIGGTAFTPIINAPDVAILGVSKASMKPVYQEGQFVPRLQLPLSLSYDHRVIDGAEAARFTQHLSQTLSDIRKLLL